LRFFTLGVGGGLGTSANRTEILTFTVSFQELREFKQRDECNLPWGIDVYGNLGLQEWVASALTPVESRQLIVGLHPPPGGKSLPAPLPRTGTGTGAELEAVVGTNPADGAITELISARNEAWDNSKRTGDFAKAAMAHAKKGNIPAAYKDASWVGRYAGKTADAVEKATHKAMEADELLLIKADPNRSKKVDVLRKSAALAGDDAAAAKKAVDALREAVPHDPPIDALSHSVQFVVAVSGSITPNWTLVHFKGPTATGSPLAAGTYTATHTLSIAMGPPAVAAVAGGPPSRTAGPEQNRQLDNMVIIQNLGQPRPLQ
jgi:hypothetical protein